MKKTFFLILFIAMAINVSAKVELPEIIGNNMMLQQNAQVNFWGKAKANATVIITTSWGEKASAKSDSNGRWIMKVKTPAGSYNVQSVIISDGEKTQIDNILIGEVWLGGGQSNMEMPLRGFWNCPIANSNEVIATANKNKNRIRYAIIPKTPAHTPQENVAGKWQECTVENAPEFGATAYFFAEMLNSVLDVPVGIINCSWGGSRVESWTNRALLETYGENLTPEAIDSYQPDYARPLAMYNGMLYPIRNYTIKGFIWYQGEANVINPESYAQRLANMVKLWRDDWKEGDIPFYFVEIAPYQYGKPTEGPLLREAQWDAVKLIPNSAAVCTNDLVEPYEEPNIHPKNKQDVGKRLAYLALNKTYGYKNVACESPQFKSMTVKDGKAYVAFTNTDEGFNRMTDIRGFEICGADKVFYPADVEIDGAKRILIISSKQVVEPNAIRYCFHNFTIGNIGNLRGLPIVPFRTDK